MSSKESVWRASPSLALIKYWGKASQADPTQGILDSNLPASESLAVGLEGLFSETRVTLAEDGRDEVVIDGREADPERYRGFFSGLRELLKSEHHFKCQSVNNFPTAAGLASSSSGFAALAAACWAASQGAEAREPDLALLSVAARIGSASAARAVWAGFVALRAGAHQASPLYPATHWPELRVVVVRISDQAKEYSSRVAMERVRLTSPYYPAWLADSPRVYQEALEALKERDLARLGGLIRRSTYRMFGSMLGAEPPIIYWLPETLAVVKTLAELRREGLEVWETMDAGPQVKIFCLADQLDELLAALTRAQPGLAERLFVSRIGGGLTRLR